jgi:hypothetical protein
MPRIDKTRIITLLLAVGLLAGSLGPAAAAVRIEGQVQVGGGPLANSAVTLWAASAGQPRQLAQTRTSSDGRFEFDSQETPGADVTLYLVAKGGEAAGRGDNPAIAMLLLLTNAPLPKGVINELTTVASSFTAARSSTERGSPGMHWDCGSPPETSPT